MEELDRKMAEKIMGWEYFECGYFGTEEETERMRELTMWMDRNHLDSVGAYYIKQGVNFWMPAIEWLPSTDMRQAVQIAERMRKRFDYGLVFISRVTMHPTFYAQFRKVLSVWGGGEGEGYSDNPAEAICLAAANALGV